MVGGGISGLATSYYLLKKSDQFPLELLLLEKNNRLGGNIITEKEGDFIIEGGPDCFISEKPWAVELIREIGIEEEITGTIPENNKTFIYWNNKLHPLPEGWALLVPTKIISFITSGLISTRGKLRVLLDLFISSSRVEDLTLAEFVERRLGNEILQKIAEPLVAGIHSADPYKMSLKATFPGFLEMEKKYGSLLIGMLKARKMLKKKDSSNRREQLSLFLTLKKGIFHLVEKLEGIIAKNNGKIIKNSSIQRIERNKNKFYIYDRNGQIYEGDAVIVTTPAWVSSNILRALSTRLTEEIGKIPYTSTLTMSLAFNKKNFNPPFRGYGFLVPAIENMNLTACTWTSQKFPYRAPGSHHLLRLFAGGYKNEKIVEEEDGNIYEKLSSELFKILNVKAKPDFIKIYKWKKAMPQYIPGHLKTVEKIDSLSEKFPGLYLTGSSYKGVGISECIKEAKVTAEKVSNYILECNNAP